MTPINFKANYINTVEIKKWDGKKYQPAKASFTELNLKDKKDLFSLKETASEWGDCFATDMYIYSRDPAPDGAKKHIYALTTQKQNFESLYPDRILGLVEFYEKPDNTNRIEFLQVQPDNVACQYSRPMFTKIGSAIVKNLKQMFPDKPIKLHSVMTAKDFYKKQDFKRDTSSFDSLDMIWNG